MDQPEENADSNAERSVSVSWEGGLPWDAFFSERGKPGGVEIIFSQLPVEARLGELASINLLALKYSDGRAVYPITTILIPGGVGLTEEMVYQWIEAAFERLRPTLPINADETAILRRRVEVVSTETLHTSSVLNHILTREGPRLFVVTSGEKYRDSSITIQPTNRGVMRATDLWMPHLANLVTSCVEKVRNTNSLVIVDVEGDPTFDLKSKDPFSEMKEVGYSVLRSSSAEEAASLAQKCLDKISAGQLEEALDLIDASSSVSKSQRALIKIRCLDRGGFHNDALREIKAGLDAGLAFEASNRIGLSNIANKHGDKALASQLLRNIPFSSCGEEALEVLIYLARLLEMNLLADDVAEFLEAHFPSDDGMRYTTLEALMELCIQSNGTTYKNVHGFPSSAREIAAWLYVKHQTDAESVLDLVEESRARWPDFEHNLQLCLAYGAAHRGMLEESLLLADPASLKGRNARFAVQILLDSLERYIVSSENTNKEVLVSAFFKLICYLAFHPGDGEVLVAFAHLVSPEVSGSNGLISLIWTVVNLAETNIVFGENTDISTEPAGEEDLLTFVRRMGERFLPSGEPVHLWRIPDDMLVPSADALLGALVRFLDFSHRHDNENFDPQTFDMFAGFGVALSRYSSVVDTELTILRIWGGRLANSNALQRSRDIAQTLLVLAKDDPVRCRLAWFGYGDIYLRGRNPLEALIGLACALATNAPLPPKQAMDELHSLVRVMRDVGMHEFSERLIPSYKRAMELAGAREVDHSRAETARISVAMRKALNRGKHPEASLPSLIDDAWRNLETAMSLNDDPTPAALLLGQMANIGRHLGIVVLPGVDEILAKARSRLVGTSALIFDMSCGDVSIEMLLRYIETLDRARFSADVGHDIEVINVATRRLLAKNEVIADPSSVIYASEMLADVAINPPVNALPHEKRSWLPSTIEWPATVAKDLSMRGVDIQFLAQNEHHRIVTVQVTNGFVGISEEVSEDTFSIDEFYAWSNSYPYGYGRNELELFDNTFFETMDRLRPVKDLARPTIFVSDTRLQQLPPNIFLVHGNFAGRQCPVAMAPSLTWLERAVSAQPRQFGLPVAWISDAAQPEAANTLNFLADLLADTLSSHGIVLDRSVSPPISLRDSEIAIIGAHGGLAEGSQYFRVVADEGMTRMTSNAVAEALDQCNVAILFVCSGGRVDRHPFSNSVLGLPKEILSRGRQAVIASPWPLDVRVPANWLPTFLDAWEAGENLLIANFKANQAVATRMGDNPANCLAMTVYGNPLLTKGDNLGVY